MHGQSTPSNIAVTAALVCCGGFAGVLHAATINEDFESYTFASDGGAEFLQQSTGWGEANVLDPGDEVHGLIKTSATDPSNQVLDLSFIDGNKNGLGGLKANDAAFDNLTGDVYVSFDLLMPNAATEDVWVFYMGDGGGRLDVRFNGGAPLVHGSQDYGFKDQGNNNVTVGSNVWYRVSGVLHLDGDDTQAPASTFDLTLTNLDTQAEIGTASGDLLNDPTTIRGYLFLYVSDGDSAQFDNIYYGAQPIPEPGTMALLGLGGLALLGRRRRA